MTLAVATQGTKFYISDGGAGSPTVFVQVKECKGLSGPSGSASIIDATHLESVFREKSKGIPDKGQIEATFNYVSSDAGQQEMREAAAQSEARSFKITLPNGETWSGQCLVMDWSQTVNVDNVIEAKSKLEITGDVTVV